MSDFDDRDRRLHVLEIAGNAIVGGMETHVRQLVERLPADTFRLSVVIPYEGAYADELRSLGADVYTTPISDEVGWRSLQFVSALIESTGVDIVHAHLPNAHALAGVAGRITHRPVLATVHGRTLTPLDVEVQRLTQSHIGALCNSCYFQAFGVGVDCSRLHPLSIGVDTDRFRPGTARHGALRRRFGIAGDAPLVGFVGRLSWEKGPDLFVRIALSVRARCPQAHFVLVGSGPMLDELVAIVAACRLESSVHFAGLEADMPSVYPQFDLAVSSSRSEATPFAIMEAMSCAVPVVAFAVGGIPELLQQGISGWLAEERDVERAAELVVAQLEQPAATVIAGQAARQRALDHCDAEQSVAATSLLLQRLGGTRAEARSGHALAVVTAR